MIYTIRYDGELISTTAGSLNQIHYNGKLTVQANNAGTLKFAFPREHVSYGKPQPMTGVIAVERDGKPIWAGRVVSYVEDKNCTRTFTCEGALAWANDVKFTSSTTMTLANAVEFFNSHSAEYKLVAGVGAATNIAVTADKTLKDAMQEHLKTAGGYFYCTVDNGSVALNYSTGSLEDAAQDVRFGDNMVDISITVNPTYQLTDFDRAINIKAVDKSFSDPSIAPFELLQAVRVVSIPHGVDQRITAEKIEIDLNNASASVLTLGKTVKRLSEIL